MAVPTRDPGAATAQVPSFAALRGTAETPRPCPAAPAASDCDAERSCSPSWRVSESVNGLKAPAVGVVVWAESPGERQGLAQPVTGNEDDGVAGAPDSGALHGSRMLVVVA